MDKLRSFIQWNLEKALHFQFENLSFLKDATCAHLRVSSPEKMLANAGTLSDMLELESSSDGHVAFENRDEAPPVDMYIAMDDESMLEVDLDAEEKFLNERFTDAGVSV